MATVYPLRGLRARPELASEVASVPYDVVNRDEARALAADKPKSFLHVTKPELDLPDELSPYDDKVYQRGAEALRRLEAEGLLVRDSEPCFYVYALTMGTHTQTGVALCASVPEYDQNIVKKHEHTRPDKENDRVRHVETTGAQTGVVFLTYRDHKPLAAELAAVTAESATVDFTADDGIRHQVWVVSSPERVAAISQGFADAGPLYIADGHHRSAAASRVAAAHRTGAPDPASPYERFLSVAFAASEVQILPYNRVVKDLRGLSTEAFLAAVGEQFTVTDGKPAKSASRQFGMFLSERWFTLVAKEPIPTDPVGRLDVSLLQDRLLGPILGIDNPRTDTRIDFVGGIRGDGELEKRVKSGRAVAFNMHATPLDDLFAIADVNEVMPPKSTWFEPKLRDGLIVYTYDS